MCIEKGWFPQICCLILLQRLSATQFCSLQQLSTCSPLYGLKQSFCTWVGCFTSLWLIVKLSTHSFTSILHMDFASIIITHNDSDEILHLKSHLHSRFQTKDLGPLSGTSWTLKLSFNMVIHSENIRHPYRIWYAWLSPKQHAYGSYCEASYGLAEAIERP